MNEVYGSCKCPTCRRPVASRPDHGTNPPEAFRCTWCPQTVCDWCYNFHTLEHAAELNIGVPADIKLALGRSKL